MSNNNLNALASKLEGIHISNQPSSASDAPTHHLRPVASAKKGVKRTVARTQRRRGSAQRGTVKMTGRQKDQERRREETRRRAAEKKEAATAKRRQTAAKRKAEEEEAQAKAVISGRTRGQAKRMKAAKMNNE